MAGQNRRNSFLIRIWWEDVGQRRQWRGRVQHVASGDATYVQDLRSLFTFIEERTGRLQPSEDEGTRDDAGTDAIPRRRICKEDTMSENTNVQVVRDLIAAFNAGTPGSLMNLLDDEAVIHVPGNSPIAGEYRGKAAIGQFFRKMGQRSEGPLHIDLQHILTGGEEHVVATWTARGVRKGVEYEGLAGYIFRVRDGKIIEARNLQEDQHEIDRFWSA